MRITTFNTLVETKLLVLLVLIMGTSNSTFGKLNSDSFQKVWQNKAVHDTIRFNALEQFYNTYNQENPDLTLSSLDYHLSLAKEKVNLVEWFNAAKRIGNIQRFKENLSIAMRAYNVADSIASIIGDSIMKAQILGNTGNVFIYKREYSRATQNYMKALKIYQSHSNIEGESHILTSLGSVYAIIHNYELALEYYMKALKILELKGIEDRRTAVIYVNIGWANYELDKNEEAKSFYLKGLKLFEKTQEKFFMLNSYASLARINRNLGDLEMARRFAVKNLKLSEELGSMSSLALARIINAQLVFENNVNEATIISEKIEADLINYASKEVKRDLYKLLYQCYKKKNEMAKALKSHELYSSYHDSIEQEKNSFAIAREAVKNEFEKKLYETQLASEKEKSEIKIRELKRTYLVAAFSTLIILSLLVFIRRFSIKNLKRRSELLSEIDKLKSTPTKELIVDSNKFELSIVKIEKHIERKLNKTDVTVLSLLMEDPTISNAKLAEKAFLSIDGIGSSLRRMYGYFDVKESKYKKISLLLEAIKISNQKQDF
ncbi:MAG: tetratricopeptide repeat protein [Bacteroidia bacterium]